MKSSPWICTWLLLLLTVATTAITATTVSSATEYPSVNNPSNNHHDNTRRPGSSQRYPTTTTTQTTNSITTSSITAYRIMADFFRALLHAATGCGSEHGDEDDGRPSTTAEDEQRERPRDQRPAGDRDDPFHVPFHRHRTLWESPSVGVVVGAATPPPPLPTPTPTVVCPHKQRHRDTMDRCVRQLRERGEYRAHEFAERLLGLREFQNMRAVRRELLEWAAASVSASASASVSAPTDTHHQHHDHRDDDDLLEILARRGFSLADYEMDEDDDDQEDDHEYDQGYSSIGYGRRPGRGLQGASGVGIDNGDAAEADAAAANHHHHHHHRLTLFLDARNLAQIQMEVRHALAAGFDPLLVLDEATRATPDLFTVQYVVMLLEQMAHFTQDQQAHLSRRLYEFARKRLVGDGRGGGRNDDSEDDNPDDSLFLRVVEDAVEQISRHPENELFNDMMVQNLEFYMGGSSSGGGGGGDFYRLLVRSQWNGRALLYRCAMLRNSRSSSRRSSRSANADAADSLQDGLRDDNHHHLDHHPDHRSDWRADWARFANDHLATLEDLYQLQRQCHAAFEAECDEFMRLVAGRLLRPRGSALLSSLASSSALSLSSSAALSAVEQQQQQLPTSSSRHPEHQHPDEHTEQHPELDVADLVRYVVAKDFRELAWFPVRLRRVLHDRLFTLDSLAIDECIDQLTVDHQRKEVRRRVEGELSQRQQRQLHQQQSPPRSETTQHDEQPLSGVSAEEAEAAAAATHGTPDTPDFPDTPGHPPGVRRQRGRLYPGRTANYDAVQVMEMIRRFGAWENPYPPSPSSSRRSRPTRPTRQPPHH